MTPSVACALGPDGIAVISIDDGRVNVLDRSVIDELVRAIASLDESHTAVVISGRDSCFSAGLDRRLASADMKQELKDTLDAYCGLLIALLHHPRPVVAAVTGHALAAGMLLAMTADRVVAAGGDFSWGLVETQVGLAHENFGIALARYRLGPRAESWALVGAKKSPVQARDAGLIDILTASVDVRRIAREEAGKLAAIPAEAFSVTKLRLRAELVASLRSSSLEGAASS